MNKIVVGMSPSPNLRKTSSKIGSLANSSHRPGGGQVKIENRKLDWNVGARTVNLNNNYTPGGGDKKVGSHGDTVMSLIVIVKLVLLFRSSRGS